MAFELGIDSVQLEKIVGLFKEAGAGAIAMADGVDKVNQSMGQMRTVGGRAVAAPANPADAAPGTPAPPVLGPRGPSESVMPWTGGVRSSLSREERALELMRRSGDTDLIRDQENRVLAAQRRVERAEKDLFIGPPEPPQAREVRTQRGTGRVDSLDPYGYEGPRQRLRRYEAMRDRAAGMGDSDLLSDWEDRVGNAKRTVDRLDGGGGGFAELAKRALLRSRINLGPLSPLAMDLAPILGEAGMGALGGASAFLGLANAGADSMRRTNAAFYTMGGSPGMVGAAMGLGGENAAAKAMAFGEALRQGSYGSAFFRGQGIYDVGPTQIDKSSNYVRALDALRGVSDVNQRIRIARDTGLTDDLWTSDLSDRSYRRLKSSLGDLGTPEERRAEAEYRAGKEEIGGWWDRQVRGFGKRAMTDIHGISGAFHALGGTPFNYDGSVNVDFAEDLLDAARAMGSVVSPFIPDEPVARPDGKKGGAKRKPVGFNGVEPVPTDRTSSGPTGNAVPVGWRGRAMNDYLDDQRMLFGGFST